MKDNKEKELVDHPDYYNREIECIEEMRLVFGDDQVATFCKLCAYKYRYGRIGKPATDTETDLKKSDWYMGYFQDLTEVHRSDQEQHKECHFRVLRKTRQAAKEKTPGLAKCKSCAERESCKEKMGFDPQATNDACSHYRPAVLYNDFNCNAQEK